MRQRVAWEAGPATLLMDVDTVSGSAVVTVTEDGRTAAVTLSRDDLLTIAAGGAPDEVRLAVVEAGEGKVRVTVVRPNGTSLDAVVDRAELQHSARYLATLR